VCILWRHILKVVYMAFFFVLHDTCFILFNSIYFVCVMCVCLVVCLCISRCTVPRWRRTSAKTAACTT